MHGGTPSIHGRWRTADPTADPATAPTPTKTPGDSAAIGDNLGVYAVHMALLHTGRVLMFSGGWEMSNLLHRSWSWDPTQSPSSAAGRWFMPEFDESPPPHTGPATRSDDPDIDLFCCHTVFLPDGRLLAVGGDAADHSNASLHVYDPLTESWTKTCGRTAPALPGVTYPAGMVAGRWYPTAVVLADGSVAVFSGDSPGGHVVDAEILRPPSYLPAVITGGRRVTGGGEKALFLYPGMHLVRGGRVFYMPTSFQYNGTEAQVLARTGPTASFRMTGPTSGSWQDHVDPADPSQPLVPVNRFREEGTSVLLPPAQAGRIMLIGGGWFTDPTQHGDHRSCEILDTQAASPTWSPAGQMHHARVNVSSVLLPDGKVLIIGGHDRYKWIPPGHTWDATLHEHAQEEAEIYDPTVAFDPANPSAAFTPVESMHAPRTYHSTAVLLPDASVLVAGGSDQHEPSQTPPRPTDEKHMEIYEPPYFFQGQRPIIDSISGTGGPADQVHYGGQFTVQYQVEAGASIASVVLMRPCASTHHTNTEQRHVPLSFAPASENTIQVQVLSDATVAPPGYYMVFLVDSNGRPCQRARFVRLSAERCTVVADRSHFSIIEAEAAAIGGVSEFSPSFYLLIDGYSPAQLGITTATPTAAQLAAFAPSFAFSDPGGGTVSNLASFATRMLLESPGSLNVAQRVTFEYGTRFTGTGMFPLAGATPESRIVRMSVNVQGHGCTSDITLFRQPNPYMLDGPTSWLSADLRVFALRPGESQSGRTLAGPDPLTYLSQFVGACDGAPPSMSHPFDQILTGQEDSRLYLATLRDGQPVFNFAIARVRYRSLSTPAPATRVFFRLFTTAVTSMAYALVSYPRNAAETLPTLGQSATDVLTIPCFGVSRDTVETTGDTLNTKPLPGDATGAEVHRYFGVWLDFNQTTPRYTDPGDGVLKSVQDLIRGRHQCLIAEIRFGPDSIPLGATPANNDNLAQRNLAIVGSDNPGPADSHLVQHTFDLRTTWPPKKGKVDPQVGAILVTHEAVTHEAVTHEAVTNEAVTHEAHTHPAEQDELMIQWGGIPEDAEATLFLPGLDADAILEAAARRPGPERLERIDAHTIRCRVADVSYIPLPAPTPMDLAGLLTIRLPESVRTGERFRVIVRQLGGFPRHVVGTFEVFISVSTSEAIRPEEERTLAVLKHIGRSIKPTSRWHAVFQRYLVGTEDKVRGVGGSPGQIEPSPTGEPPRPPDAKTGRCWRLSLLVLVLMALFIVSASLADLTIWPFVLVTLALAVAFVLWAGLCHVSACKRLMILAIGATLGVGILGALWLLGALAPAAIWLLALGAVLAGVLLVVALACISSKDADPDDCCL